MGELKEKMGGSGRVGLSADALKWIAMITMFIDHLAHTSLNPYGPHYVEIYTAMRTIGRIAFPLYCFLLVEGFMHTGNYRRYVLRIGLFTLLSEIPFDLAMNGAVIFWNYQSVMVTLLIGLVGLGAYRWCVCNRYPIYGIMVVLASVATGMLTKCDYGAEGVLLIFLFYLLQHQPVVRAVCVAVWCVMMGGLEVWGVLALLPIMLYNGQKGRGKSGFKWFGYAFYPAHLAFLWGINRVAGVLADMFLS